MTLGGSSSEATQYKILAQSGSRGTDITVSGTTEGAFVRRKKRIRFVMHRIFETTVYHRILKCCIAVGCMSEGYVLDRDMNKIKFITSTSTP